MKTTLTVTARGQITLNQEILKHLHIKPGEKIELALMPDGRSMLQAAKPSQSIDSVIGLLANRSNKRASLEELDAAISQSWSESSANK